VSWERKTVVSYVYGEKAAAVMSATKSTRPEGRRVCSVLTPLSTRTSLSTTSYAVTHYSMLYTTSAVDTTNQSVVSDRSGVLSGALIQELSFSSFLLGDGASRTRADVYSMCLVFVCIHALQRYSLFFEFPLEVESSP